jgi:hypothetical protein
MTTTIENNAALLLFDDVVVLIYLEKTGNLSSSMTVAVVFVS